MNSSLKRTINRLVLLAVFIMGIAGGVILFDRIFMPKFIRGGGTIEIPDITEKPIDEAEKIASKKGFDFLIVRREHSDSIPEDFVISQRPMPGSAAKKGRRISVVVSLSAASTEIPDISGEHYRSAVLEIERNGLVVEEITYEYSDSFKNEFVITSKPSPGTEVRLNSNVNLIVSMGSEKELVRVPNFSGQQIEPAEELGKKVGLKVVATYRKIPSLQPKTVYSQNLDPGTLVERGTVVYVIVARPKE